MMKDVNEVDRYLRWNPKTKLYEPVAWEREIVPYCLQHDGTDTAFAVGVATVAPPPILYKLPHTSLGGLDKGLGNPLLITKIVFEDETDTTAAANWSVMLRDMGDKTQFMNQPIHVRAFAGTAQLPGNLFEPLFLPSRHTLMLIAQKYSGNTAHARLGFWGGLHLCWSQTLAQYPADRQILHTLVGKYLERRKSVFPFWLTTETTPNLAVNQSGEYEMLVGEDGHFEASHYMYVSAADFEVEIYNPLTKQAMMNGKIQASGSIGTGADYPQKLPVPWLIPSGQRLRLKITCLSGGATNNIYLVFRGRKIRAPLREYKQVLKDLDVQPRKVAQQVAKTVARQPAKPVGV